MCRVINEGKVEYHSKISTLSNWMQLSDAINWSENASVKVRMEQVDKTNSVSRYDDTAVPCVGHSGGARIAGNGKLRSRVQKRGWGWNLKFGNQPGFC